MLIGMHACLGCAFLLGSYCVLLTFPSVSPCVAPLNSHNFIYNKGDRPHKLYAQLHAVYGEYPKLDLCLVTPYPDCQSILLVINRHQCHLLLSFLSSLHSSDKLHPLSFLHSRVPSPIFLL